MGIFEKKSVLYNEDTDDFKKRKVDEFGYPYKFSVVMAVYKVEKYINEAIDSIIKQSIGFVKSIQLILVDDGSPDSSGDICDRYKEAYPDNIVVIHKENGGVSSARNAGLKFVEGRYVNFMDSDDVISQDAFEKVYNFFIKNESETDVVSIPIRKFEAVDEDHYFNYKFKKGSRVIMLKNEYKSVQLHTNSCFFKRSCAIDFDTNLINSEDSKEVAKILIYKQTLGVVHDCRYYLRVRTGENLSATQTMQSKSEWFLPYMKQYSLWTYNYYKERLNYIPFYIQYSVIYDLQWKFRTPNFPDNVLTDEEKAEFLSLIKELLTQTDDKIICEMPWVWLEHKNYMLMIKHGQLPDIQACNNSALVSYKNLNLYWIEDTWTSLDFMNVSDGNLIIEGRACVMLPFDEMDVLLKVNDEFVDTEVTFHTRPVYTLDKRISVLIAFKCAVCLENCSGSVAVSLFCRLPDGNLVARKKILTGKFFPINKENKKAYLYENGFKIVLDDYTLKITKCGLKAHIKAELSYLKELSRSKKNGARKAVVVRSLYHMVKPFVRKKIWLVFDKANRADDNGEAFYKYVLKNKSGNISAVFSINKNTADYKRIKKMGTVVPFLSYFYKLIFLLSDKVISSHFDDYCINPFFPSGTARFYADLNIKRSFIFLQHGITKDDMSNLLGRYSINCRLFVTSTHSEFNSILELPYYYSESEVILTGFPRYDYLTADKKKIITIMPTWRRSLFSGYDMSKSVWILKDDFEKTAFYRFYSRLLDDASLHKVMLENGYSLNLVLHPNLIPYAGKFHFDNEVNVLVKDFKYSQIFSESSLIVTDYTSAAFDFAYLRKPIIYSQFDYENFRSSHYKEGYFDYVRDGFGEVEYTLESTISRVIEYINNGCELKEKYRTRIDEAFPFNDKNNCERVYDAICSIKI